MILNALDFLILFIFSKFAKLYLITWFLKIKDIELVYLNKTLLKYFKKYFRLKVSLRNLELKLLMDLNFEI